MTLKWGFNGGCTNYASGVLCRDDEIRPSQRFRESVGRDLVPAGNQGANSLHFISRDVCRSPDLNQPGFLRVSTMAVKTQPLLGVCDRAMGRSEGMSDRTNL